jgi:hypothetical protein
MGSKQSKDGAHFRIRAQKRQKIFFEPVEIHWAQINLFGLSCSLIEGSKSIFPYSGAQGSTHFRSLAYSL